MMRESLVALLVQIGAQHGLPRELLPAIAYVESRGHVHVAVTRGGCAGMFQMSPLIRARYHAPDVTDIEQQAHGAARYLASLRRRWGSWFAAIRHYNPGDKGYLRRVLRAMGKVLWISIKN